MKIREQLALEYGRDIILHVRASDGRILAANQAALRAYGYTREELLALTVYDLRASDTLSWASSQMAEADTHSILFETEHQRKDGSVFPVEVSSQGVTIEGVRTLISVVRDNTVRRRMERDLRLSEERERARAGEVAAILDAVPLATLIARDPQCRELTGSRVTYELLRLPPGTNIVEPLAAGHFRILKGGVQLALEDLPIAIAARTARPLKDYECEVAFPDGTRRALFGSAVPLLDDDGQTRGALAAFLDITERKTMEERLRESQKLESIGLLAGGLAHDFNNLLVSVIGNASLAARLIADESPAQAKLRGVIEAGERAARLTRQMLDYAGKGRFVLAEVDLSKVLRDSIGHFRNTVPKGISLRIDLADGLPPVESDPRQMAQVFLNLAQNAVEAIGQGPGEIAIATGARDAVPANMRDELGNWSLPPGRCVYLEVRDSGRGMDSATLARAFDPFFSTKFQGRGLGLAAVAGVVRSHQGAIRVTTAPGQGATFLVLLPASQTAEAPRGAPAPEVASGAGTLLVVDDDAQVRGLAQAALECHGYQVLTAASGAEALGTLQAMRARGGRIGLAILDLSMPGMSGEETLTRLRALQPDLPAIVSSGYPEAEWRPKLRDAPVSGFLQKPYTLEALTRAVAQSMPPRR